MGFFSDLKDKVFGGKADESTTETTSEATSTDSLSEESLVDIAAMLDGLENPESLNWRTSIVDLLKLVGMDSSYGARKELASDVGLEGYEGSAEDNVALNKAVLVKLVENGGTIPDDLIS